jgi:ABC-type Fe3+-hydroxamate transport system substrate-binding protein
MARTIRAFRPAARVRVSEGGDVNAGEGDLVVAWASSPAADMLLAQPPTEAPVYVAADDSPASVERSLADLGVLVDRPLAGRRLAERLAEARRQVSSRLAGSKRVTVFLDTGFFTTVSSRSLDGRLIEEAGGSNIAGPTPNPGPFDLRDLMRINPQVYVATSDSGTTLAALKKNKRTRRLRAVQERRFGIVPARFLAPGPFVDRGLEALARILHPDAFR